jgi:hypothetical protein
LPATPFSGGQRDWRFFDQLVVTSFFSRLAVNFSSQLLAEMDLVLVKKLPASTPTRITLTAVYSTNLCAAHTGAHLRRVSWSYAGGKRTRSLLERAAEAPAGVASPGAVDALIVHHQTENGSDCP